MGCRELLAVLAVLKSSIEVVRSKALALNDLSKVEVFLLNIYLYRTFSWDIKEFLRRSREETAKRQQQEAAINNKIIEMSGPTSLRPAFPDRDQSSKTPVSASASASNVPNSRLSFQNKNDSDDDED